MGDGGGDLPQRYNVITHRIHVTGIFAYMTCLIFMVNVVGKFGDLPRYSLVFQANTS